MKNKIQLAIIFILSILSCEEPKLVGVKHMCDNTGMWYKIHWVNDNVEGKYTCDMCHTITCIKNGKLIKEDATNKRKPVNTFFLN